MVHVSFEFMLMMFTFWAEAYIPKRQTQTL